MISLRNMLAGSAMTMMFVSTGALAEKGDYERPDLSQEEITDVTEYAEEETAYRATDEELIEEREKFMEMMSDEQKAELIKQQKLKEKAFSDMTPEEQEFIKATEAKKEEHWRGMSREDRNTARALPHAAPRVKAREFQNLSDEEKAMVIKRQKMMEQMTPEQREAFKRKMMMEERARRQAAGDGGDN